MFPSRRLGGPVNRINRPYTTWERENEGVVPTPPRVEWVPSGEVNYSVHRNMVDLLAVASATAAEGDRRAGPGGRRPHEATMFRHRLSPPTPAGGATEPTSCLIASVVVHRSEGTSAPPRHGEERHR